MAGINIRQVLHVQNLFFRKIEFDYFSILSIRPNLWKANEILELIFYQVMELPISIGLRIIHQLYSSSRKIIVVRLNGVIIKPVEINYIAEIGLAGRNFVCSGMENRKIHQRLFNKSKLKHTKSDWDKRL